MRYIKVTNCEGCPYFRPESYAFSLPYCEHKEFHLGRIIKKLWVKRVPKWCPLEVAI